VRVLFAVLRIAGMAFLAVLAFSAAALGWRMIAPIRVAALPNGQCTEVSLDTNGWHTDIVFPAAILSRDHPFRRLYPSARTFSVGWGDRDAYRFADKDPWLNLWAVVPPSPTLLHVSADSAPDALGGGPSVAISRAGADGLAAFIDRSLSRDARGDAIVVGPGYQARSVFVESPDEFHIFRLCNQWIAEALKAAGLPVSPLGAWTAGSVTRQVSRGPHCADGAASSENRPGALH